MGACASVPLEVQKLLYDGWPDGAPAYLFEGLSEMDSKQLRFLATRESEVVG